MGKWLKRWLLLVGWSALCAGGTTVVAEGVNERPRNILVLLSYHSIDPWVQSMMKGFQQSTRAYPQQFRYYFEYLDAVRLEEAVSDEVRVDYLSDKYSDIRFDAAVADSPEAARFLKRHGERLLPEGAPRVYSTDTDIGVVEQPDEYVIRGWKADSTRETVEMALKQNSQAKEVVIVRGTWAAADLVHDGLLEQLRRHPRLNVRTVDFTSFDQLREQLADLPEQSLLFYILIFKDKTGKKLNAKVVLRYIAEYVEVPVYSFWKNMLGEGIVGGYLRDGERTAIGMVEALMDYFQRGRFKPHYSILSWGADWEQLERHGLSMSDVGDEVKYLNQPPELLEYYFREIVYVVLFLGGVVVLLTYYWKRKVARINRELRYTRNSLEVERRKQGSVAVGTVKSYLNPANHSQIK